MWLDNPFKWLRRKVSNFEVVRQDTCLRRLHEVCHVLRSLYKMSQKRDLMISMISHAKLKESGKDYMKSVKY